MESFHLGKEFANFDEVLQAKKNYEQASNTILSICGSNLLKGNGDFVKSKKYYRLCFECKAGKERKPKSQGIRATSTYKVNCPFKVK